MLNVVVNGKYEQRELECIQTMRDGQPSRMVPRLREGEEAHYTVGGGIVIVQHQLPDPNLITEVYFDPHYEIGRYVVKYADGRESEVSRERAEFIREEMEARHAKF